MVFLGTPSFAVPSLQAVARECDLVAVITQPDRPRGRGRKSAPSAVAVEAERLGVPLLKPEGLRSGATRKALESHGADLFAVVAFGEILSPELLRVPRLGCINLHPSLLPAYRGPSPVQRALWDGCAGTGVTTLWMDEGVDTGDLILQRWVGIVPADTAGALAARLADLGAPVLAETLLLAHAGRAPRRPQDAARASHAPKLAKQDGVMNWSLDAVTVWNHQRAVTPWPGAATAHRGHRVQVTRAWPHHTLAVPQPPGAVIAIFEKSIAVACNPGVLLVERVKPEGRNDMDAADWARGARFEPGEQLAFAEEAHA
ncbi:MAG TPA: methionyl-tRNA formyltransferase [Candidatus Eisenbacteria bacterium]